MTDGSHLTRMEKLLLEAARTFNATLEYEELIERVLRLVMGAVNCEAALVFRVDHSRTDMKIRCMKRGDDAMRICFRELGSGVLDWVATYREPMIINDAENNPRTDPQIERQVDVTMRSLLSVPLIGKGQMIGVVEAINKIDGEFTGFDLDMLVGMNNQMAVAIDNAHLYRVVKQEALAKDLLYRIGKKLSGTLELAEVLHEVVDSMKQVVAFDAGAVYVVEPEESEIEALYSVGYDSGVDLRLNIGQGLAGHVAKSGEPVIVPNVRADDRYVNARDATCSEIAVPMLIEERVIGVFNLESDRIGAFDNQALDMLAAFASQAAISIERARLHKSVLESQRLRQQLSIARQIQQTFLPDANPKIVGYDITGWNIPSGEVGGDYYDFIKIVAGQTGIAIADVSGKGIPASLIMAAYRASLIAEIRNNYAIRTICRKVNNLLVESVQPGTFVTAVYGVLDSNNHILTFSNAGHSLPFVLRQSGDVEHLKQGGQAMGVTRDSTYEERPIFLNKGEIVVLYTDGVTEVFDPDGDEFGLERLVDVVAKNRDEPAVEIQRAIYEAVHGFASPQHVFDDFTMVIIKRLE